MTMGCLQVPHLGSLVWLPDVLEEVGIQRSKIFLEEC